MTIWVWKDFVWRRHFAGPVQRRAVHGLGLSKLMILCMAAGGMDSGVAQSTRKLPNVHSGTAELSRSAGVSPGTAKDSRNSLTERPPQTIHRQGGVVGQVGSGNVFKRFIGLFNPLAPLPPAEKERNAATLQGIPKPRVFRDDRTHEAEGISIFEISR